MPLERLVTLNTLSENTLSEKTLSENIFSENTLSENTLSEKTLSENTPLENTLLENALSFGHHQDCHHGHHGHHGHQKKKLLGMSQYCKSNRQVCQNYWQYVSVKTANKAQHTQTRPNRHAKMYG